MEKTKIQLMCWWASSESLHQRIIRQFIHDSDLEQYEFVTENPDYTIVFGRTEWEKIQTTKEFTFYISQEPIWSPNQPKDEIHNYCSKIFISDKKEYPDREEYVETLLPMFYAGRDENNPEEEWDWSKKIFKTEYSKDKCISMVVTRSYNSHFYHLANPETSRIIYVERTDISDNISKNITDINIWGTFQENNGINLHGEIWTKLVALKDYKFSICSENTIQKNYISEKFWDCVLSDTVPIYFGCNNIHEYIPKDFFINLTDKIDDYNYIESKLKFILNNCDSLYEKYLPKVKELKHKFTYDPNFNLWEFIKKQINENSVVPVKNNLKILLTTKFWTDGMENSTRLRNVLYCHPKMVELTNFLKSNNIDCEFKLYDFSPTQIVENSVHRPYPLGEYKKAEKTNLILKENKNFDYMFMFDSDEFFIESDYPKILDILKNLEKRKIITFDAAKLEQSSVDKIVSGEEFSFFDEDWAFAYSGKKSNGPLFAGLSGGLGGVFICDMDLINENGGFDESFIGWGGEDGDMLSRIYYSGKPYEMIPQRDFFPFHLPHFCDWTNEKYNKRFTES
jgi:hypothetical protein